MKYEVTVGGRTRQVELTKQEKHWRCLIDDREWVVEVLQFQRESLTLLVAGDVYEVRRDRKLQSTEIWVRGASIPVDARDPRSLRARRAAASSGDGPQKLLASMPGKIVRVLLSENDPVEPGQGILVIEAMKMQNEVKSPKKGIVREILVQPGAAVNAGDVLAVVE